MKTSLKRTRALTSRSNLALLASAAPALFLTLALAGSGGRWSPMHTWFAVAVVALAVISLACRALAGLTRPQEAHPGDSPPVTHPSRIMSQTRSEVAK